MYFKQLLFLILNSFLLINKSTAAIPPWDNQIPPLESFDSIKSKYFLKSYQNLQESHYQIERELLKAENKCEAQLSILRDTYDTIVDSEQPSIINLGILEKAMKILDVSKKNEEMLKNISTSIVGFTSETEIERKAVLDNQEAMFAELKKIGNVMTQLDDNLVRKVDNMEAKINMMTRSILGIKVIFEENFAFENYTERWTGFFGNNLLLANYKRVRIDSGEYGKNFALRTQKELSYPEGIVSRYPPFSTKEKTVVIQFSSKISIGDAFVRLHDCNTRLNSIQSWDTFSLLFGIRISKIKANSMRFLYMVKDPRNGIRYDQNNRIDAIEGSNDRYTHIYTLEVNEDNTFNILIDDKIIHTDIMEAPFYGFESLCGISYFNQDNSLPIEVDNILFTSDVEYAKNRRMEVLQYLELEKEFEYTNSK